MAPNDRSFEFFLVTASVVLCYTCMSSAPGAQNPILWFFVWAFAIEAWVYSITR